LKKDITIQKATSNWTKVFQAEKLKDILDDALDFFSNGSAQFLKAT
jgi:hypothetical protein